MKKQKYEFTIFAMNLGSFCLLLGITLAVMTNDFDSLWFPCSWAGFCTVVTFVVETILGESK